MMCAEPLIFLPLFFFSQKLLHIQYRHERPSHRISETLSLMRSQLSGICSQNGEADSVDLEYAN